MARLKPLSKGINLYSVIAMQPAAGKMAQWSQDARRALIFGKRLAAGAIIGPRDPNVAEHSEIDPYYTRLQQRVGSIKTTHPNVVPHTDFVGNEKSKVLNNYVAIIDIDVNGYNDGYEIIKLPYIPRELSINSESSFVSIKPIGRNTSKYHYTGSEDIIEFEIDWHSHDNDRRDVITQCRKIEALSKSDGYTRDPHRVLLQWGDEDLLFKNHIFIVLSAKYRLTQFNKGFLDKNNNIVNNYMLPVQAYQQVRLGRISSHNLTKKEIEYVAKQNTTSSTLERSALTKGV